MKSTYVTSKVTPRQNVNKERRVNMNDEVKPKLELISLFSTPCVKTNIGRDFTEDELQFLFHNLPMRKDEQEEMANHQSKDFQIFDSYTDTLKDIRNFCEQQLKTYLEEIDGVDIDLTGLRITQSWLNRTKPGESHHPHIHRNSYLSGVLYISCLPNDGILFNNRLKGMFNNMEFPLKEGTQWNAKNIEQPVTEGDLIIFPSWVPHFVNRNETKNRERISLAFNTFPIGEMGNDKFANHLKL